MSELAKFLQRSHVSDTKKINLDSARRDPATMQYKGLGNPRFDKDHGAVIYPGEGDSVLFMGQDDRYGTTLKQSQKGGDFANKIILATGFLNEGHQDKDQIDLSDPNVRYGAGITIYQRTDTGKENAFFPERDRFLSSADQTSEEFEKMATKYKLAQKKYKVNRERKATTEAPQAAVSVVEVMADTVELKARNGGVNIVAGIDPSIPTYGLPRPKGKMAHTLEKGNSGWLGVSLIAGNPDLEDLRTDKTYGMQPMVKGNNLVDALEELNDRVSQLNGIVVKIQKAIAKMDIAIGKLAKDIAFHEHDVTVVVQTTTGPATGQGRAWQSALLGVKVGQFTFKTMEKGFENIQSLFSLVTSKYNTVVQKVNMSVVSEKSVLSKFHKLN
jgi:hypothetical protein